MTDIKVSSRPKQKKGKRRGRRIPRGLPLNEMMWRWRYDVGTISSNSSGNVAPASFSPSIVQASEYSTVSSLFNEVKLVRCVVNWAPKAGSLTVSQGTVAVGTSQYYNYTNPVTPSSTTSVANLARPKLISSAAVSVIRYGMWVPRGLMYSRTDADSPATVTPYAGSPGAVIAFGAGFTPSTAYFDVWLEVVSHLRGRQ